ncbi:unnamed protein product [Lepidochelys kempii]
MQEWLDVKCHGLRNTNAYVQVYDICNPESFEYMKMIQQQIMENRVGGTREAPIIVVGNKRDQQKQRFMPPRTLSVLVKKSWKCGSMECSAKYNGHIVLLFKEMLSSVLARGCKHHHSTMRLQGALCTTRCSLMGDMLPATSRGCSLCSGRRVGAGWELVTQRHLKWALCAAGTLPPPPRLSWRQGFHCVVVLGTCAPTSQGLSTCCWLQSR